MILYIILSYLITLGMIMESYGDSQTPAEAWLVWFISPITCPIIISMDIAKKRK